MSLFKRKDSPYWWVKFSHNGGRVQASSGTANKKQAQEFHDRYKATLWEQQRLGVKPERSWEETVVRYIAETKHKKSHEKDLAHLRWLDRHFRGLKLSQITRDRIDQITSIRISEGVSNASVNRILAVVRATLRKAANDWEWIERVPKVRLLPEPKLRVRFITREQAVVLLKELPPHLSALAEFSLWTGLRQGNARDLVWSQVDLKGRKLWIEAHQAKGGKSIAVPLTSRAVEILGQQLGKHPERVFTYCGNPIQQIGTRAWRSALQRAGITNFRWHDLRHTWASWHAQNGTPQSVLQELGGWESASMVRRYAHFSPEHLSGYADRLGDKITLLGGVATI